MRLVASGGLGTEIVAIACIRQRVFGRERWIFCAIDRLFFRTMPMTRPERTEAALPAARIWCGVSCEVPVILVDDGVEALRISPRDSSSVMAMGRPREAARKRSRMKRERQIIRRLACISGVEITSVSSLCKPRKSPERMAIPRRHQIMLTAVVSKDRGHVYVLRSRQMLCLSSSVPTCIRPSG